MTDDKTRQCRETFGAENKIKQGQICTLKNMNQISCFKQRVGHESRYHVYINKLWMQNADNKNSIETQIRSFSRFLGKCACKKNHKLPDWQIMNM